MISVITPSVRKEGIALVEKALRKQTFTDFEWLIVSPNHGWELRTTIRNVKRLQEPPKLDENVWNLNRAYNYAIKKSKGDLIVSWQDWTYAKADTLERFWYHYQAEPKTLVTGVGNKYTDESWSVVTWQDPRKRTDQGTYYQCYFNDIEFNFCSIPKDALYAVGGFDQELDKWYGMDGYSVVDRINMIGGYDFKIDQTLESYSLEHGRPEKWEQLNAIHGPYNERRKIYLVNPILHYL